MHQSTPLTRSARHLTPVLLGVLPLGILCLGPVWGGGPVAFGQGSRDYSRQQSHGPIGDSNLDLNTPLVNRLKMAQQSSQAQELLRKSLANREFLQQLFKNLSEDDKKALEGLAESVGQERIKLSPQHPFVKQLQEVFKNQENSTQPFPPIPSGLEEKLKGLLPRGPASPISPGASGINGTGTPNQPPAPPAGLGNAAPGSEDMNGPGRLRTELDDPFQRWLLRQFQDSPGLHDAVEDLLRFRPRAGAGLSNALKDTLGDRLLQRVERFLPESSFWTNKVLPNLPHLPLPSLSKFHLPEFKAPPSLPSFGSPRFSVPDPPSGTIGYGWLAVPVCVLLGLLGWKIFQGQRRRWPWDDRAEPDRAWALGPWPVAPSAVSSGADLIRAFEYLTLLKLGPTARSWNHRAIAAGLGGGHTERRRVAEHLATLYEQARYAPRQEAFPAAALPSARRELAYLAEVAPA